MDTAVDPAEVAKYRDMMRNGRTLPSMAAVATPATEPLQRPRKRSPKGTDRFGEINAFVDSTLAKLSRSEIATWLALFRLTDARVGTAQASVEAIAATIGASKQHTIKAVNALIAMGLLERLKVGGINRGSSIYKIRSTGHLRVTKH